MPRLTTLAPPQMVRGFNFTEIARENDDFNKVLPTEDNRLRSEAKWVQLLHNAELQDFGFAVRD